MPNVLAHSWATRGDGTRRRVHSPVAATRTTVVSVTAVFGSTYASTPCRECTNSSRWIRSSLTAGRRVPGRWRRLKIPTRAGYGTLVLRPGRQDTLGHPVARVPG